MPEGIEMGKIFTQEQAESLALHIKKTYNFKTVVSHYPVYVAENKMDTCFVVGLFVDDFCTVSLDSYEDWNGFKQLARIVTKTDDSEVERQTMEKQVAESY